MKKILLKKAETISGKTQFNRYRTDYANQLNPAQYDAVMHNAGPALVIAGAGTGKTRTLVYRVSRLIEDGIPPQAILLLTFTRKSATEMLRRASQLLDSRCESVSGGTFHSFALGTLRKYAEKIGYTSNFSVIDQSDSEDTIHLIRNSMKLDKSKKRFPQKATILNVYSMSVNKRSTIREILAADYPQFEVFSDDVEAIISQFEAYKKKHNLMTYDDLLVNLHSLLKNNPDTAKEISDRYAQIMVDEYQDTNRLQHEIVLLLAGKKCNVMAVGDDAQSIYAFRGADYQNIFFFPQSFPDCTIYKIEENYRSTQPILNLTNEIINNAEFKYAKNLYTRRTGGELPKLISAANERQQSQFVAQQILELREEGIGLDEIAVLFRSGFHSFDLEIELAKSYIPYRKFGGMKFVESAHIKDMLSIMRIIGNDRDAISLTRSLMLLDGIGPNTAQKVIDSLMSGELAFTKKNDFQGFTRGKDALISFFDFINQLCTKRYLPGEMAQVISDYYAPLMKKKYDDWNKRSRDVSTFVTIAERYKTLPEFLNDMAIDPPSETLADMEPEDKEEEYLTMSTIHSAKGLEWKVVILIWALEGRFPSAKAVDNLDSMEEERRLFYVCCTRAQDELYIVFPSQIYDRESGAILSSPSRFVANMEDDLIDKYVLAVDSQENGDFANN